MCMPKNKLRGSILKNINEFKANAAGKQMANALFKRWSRGCYNCVKSKHGYTETTFTPSPVLMTRLFPDRTPIN